MDVVVTGSSGLIGSALLPALEEAGHRPIRLVRGKPSTGSDEIEWNPSAGTIDHESLEGVGGVIHLAGAGIGDKRWTKEYKQTILESRTTGTSLLAHTIANLQTPPRVLLSGSAIGYYGPHGDETITEATPPGNTFLADVCVQWERSAQPADDAGIRTVFLRTGIVQTPKGGALKKLLPLFKLYVGGKFGSGTQYQSWITLEDEVGAMLHLLEADVRGPVNLTAPAPVTNAEYTNVLADVLGRPAVVPVPAFGPRILLGREMADSLLFESQKILPTVLIDSGFQFAHPDLETGLRSVLAK